MADPNQRIAALEAELAQLRRVIEAHESILEGLGEALFPDSPPECARGEFMFDAMGACLVIKRLRMALAAAESKDR